MALEDHVSATCPNRGRLVAYLKAFRADPITSRVCAFFEQSLNENLVRPELFERFCARLGILLPGKVLDCDPETVEREIDELEPFFCQGPSIMADPTLLVSHVLRFESFCLGWVHGPRSKTEKDLALAEWRIGHALGAPGRHYPMKMRGLRRSFWVTQSDALAAYPLMNADRVRDLLGLSHINRGFLMVAQLRVDQTSGLYRPTALDALHRASFQLARNPDGWGLTDDLQGPRPTPGLPEGVVTETHCLCEVTSLGDLTTLAPRI